METDISFRTLTHFAKTIILHSLRWLFMTQKSNIYVPWLLKKYRKQCLSITQRYNLQARNGQTLPNSSSASISNYCTTVAGLSWSNILLCFGTQVSFLIRYIVCQRPWQEAARYLTQQLLVTPSAGSITLSTLPLESECSNQLPMF